MRSKYILVVGAETILLVESVDTALGCDGLLGAGVERMALGANFYVDLGLCGAGHKSIATVACYGCLIILRMNILLHVSSLLSVSLH